MKRLVLILGLIPFTSGCDRTRHGAAIETTESEQSRSSKATENIMAGVQQDTDRARIALLENQMDTLSAQVARSDATTLEARVSALEARLPTGAADPLAADPTATGPAVSNTASPAITQTSQR